MTHNICIAATLSAVVGVRADGYVAGQSPTTQDSVFII